jgi:hypothetical protein
MESTNDRRNESWAKYTEIGENLRNKEFNIRLLCPECDGIITDFSCPTCKTQSKQSLDGKVVYSGVSLAITTVISWIMPFICAGIGYLITRPAHFGTIIGLAIGSSMALFMRRTEKESHVRTKAGIAPEVLLAETYEHRVETYDMAAFCYIHWIRSRVMFAPPRGMAMFLWRYREASGANGELRQCLLDSVFYSLCNQLFTQSADVWSQPTANLLLASTNESTEQVAIAKFWKDWWVTNQTDPRRLWKLSDFISTTAPLLAAAFRGTQPSVPSTPDRHMISYVGGDRWPERMPELIPNSLGQSGLSFSYINGKRLVVITANTILSGSALSDSSTAKVSFSEPLDSIKEICDELSVDGRSHLGVWLLASDHYYHFPTTSPLCRTLRETGRLPASAHFSELRRPRASKKIFWARFLTILFVLTFAACIYLFVNDQVKPSTDFALVVSFTTLLSFFGAGFSAITWLSGRQGGKNTFLAARGIRKFRDLANPATSLSTT